MALGRATFFPDPAGVLVWPAARTVIVADLHLEKGTSYANRHITLPPYDSRATITRLADVVTRLRPERVIALGDSFHDKGAEARLSEADALALEAITAMVEMVWVLGNHDPVPPARFAGRVAREIVEDGVTLRHQPIRRREPAEIIGHFHPCAVISRAGRRVRRKCFAGDGRRLVLPAFGAYTGGLNLLDPAYADVLATPFDAYLLGRDGVYAVASRHLVPDAGNGWGNAGPLIRA